MRIFAALAISMAAIPCSAQELTLEGTVADTTGAVIPGAAVTLTHATSGLEQRTWSGPAGEFRFTGLTRGSYSLMAEAAGMAPGNRQVRLEPGTAAIELQLNPATEASRMVVTGQIVATAADLARLPGSVDVINRADLEASRVLTVEEALRKVAGVHARAEDGFGLRPNIGIRGLNPTRSGKVLLLEDGLPLSYAPYGDNASYYHPPVDRFEGIEVVKGGGQIVYGPMTVGGVVNYVTPAIPDKREGSVTLIGGNRDYFNGHAQFGGSFGRFGLLLDAMRKQGDGSRENTHHGLTDWNAKATAALSSSHRLGLRFNRYSEDSNLTYSGLREAEWIANPRGNPFRNDFFNIARYGASVNHTWAPTGNVLVTGNAYASIFLRDWWRQSSNSAQRPNDAADPACGGMLNLHTTCGNEGRLRAYDTWGVEPKVRAFHNLFGLAGETEAGIRFHSEIQERYQKNGPLPTSRDGVLVENNDRRARAWSGFAQHRFLLGRLTITPGLRLERVRYNRTNFLANAGRGVFGATRLTQWIPGLGAAWSANDRVTLFAGVHRGFAPPRVEDVIDNNTGATIDLAPELSWNWEAGVRSRVTRDWNLEAALYRMDFSNQIVPSSVAGGQGATLTNAGRTLHQGAEFSGRWTRRALFATRHGLGLRGAYTWAPVSRYSETRFSSIPGFAAVRITGNRLPYSPAHLLTASASYFHATGVNAVLEGVYTARQFGDDLNTIGGTPDGQRGALPGNALWNLTVNYPVEAWKANFFVAAKNLSDRLTIVDRTRGLLPGMPRTVQFGVKLRFW